MIASALSICRTILTVPLLAIIAASATFAREGPPAPLHVVTVEAQLIVVAEVTEVINHRREAHPAQPAATQPADTSGSPDFTARLRVLETFKGAVRQGDDVDVAFSGGEDSPCYKAGETVLVFLEYSTDRHRWETCHNHYGLRALPDADARTAYAECVRAFQHAESLADSAARRAALIDGLALCLDHPATRWDGAYELLLALNANAFDHRPHQLDATIQDLTPACREALMRGLMSLDRKDNLRWIFRETIRKYYDPNKIEEKLDTLNGMKLMEAPVARRTGELMTELSYELGWPDGRASAQRLADAVESGAKASERQRIVQQYRRDATRRVREIKRQIQ